MSENKDVYNGYSICFNEWALDKEIKNELGLLLIISSLTAEKGYCYASNDYFSSLFNIPANSVSIKIKKLEEKGYITIDYQKRGCEVISREIRLSKIQTDDIRKFKPTILENSKENNISINNINRNTNITDSITSIEDNTNTKDTTTIKDTLCNISTKRCQKFIPPSFAEVEMYINEKGYNVDAKTFYEYFSVSGWVDSKGNKVKNWKQKIITWNNSSSKNTKLNQRQEINYTALN